MKNTFLSEVKNIGIITIASLIYAVGIIVVISGLVFQDWTVAFYALATVTVSGKAKILQHSW